MLFSFLWTISVCTKENRQHTNTLQPSNWIMGHNKPEVLKNISLMTYCSSQYGGFKLFVSNNEFVRCRILPPYCIYLSVYNCLFYHILGIVCSSSQLRRLCLVCCYSNSDEGLSEAAAKLPLLEELSIALCSLSKNIWKLWGAVVPFWNHSNGISSGLLLLDFVRKSVMRRQLLLQRTCPNYGASSLLEISWQMMVCRPYLMVVLTSNHLT